MTEFTALLTMKGAGGVLLRGPDGRFKAIRTFDNLVVDAGKNRLTTQSLDELNSVDKFKAIVIGTDNTAPNASDTDLGGTLSDVDSRATGTFVGPGTLGMGICRLSTSHTDLTAAISEAGIFDMTDSSGQTMLCRATFSSVTLSTADTLNILYTISFT